MAGGLVMKRTPIKRKTPIRARRKATGEREAFKAVWESRPHICERCGAKISEAKPVNFAHVLPKSQRRDLRLDPSNIQLVCRACHMEEHSAGKVNDYLPD